MQDTNQKAIIIGAGIAGCSTAYALAKRGFAVTLIERHQTIAQEASGNPVGMLYPKFNSGVSILSTIASQGFAFTLSLLKQLPDNNKIFDICGQIQLAFNAREQENQAKLLTATHLKPFIQQLSATEASEKANITLKAGGLYLPDSGWVKPKVFCQALTNTDFIKTMTATQAISIEQQSTHWVVSLNKNQVLETDIIVLCNANDIHQFELCKHIPITPVRGQVNFFKANALSEQIKPVICSDHYLSPAVDGLHAIGTSYGPNDLNPALSNHDTQANLQALNKISPALFHSINNATVTGRVAWRSATRDYIPLAGQLLDEQVLRRSPPRYNDNPCDLPWLKGLYVNAGHGSKGMITAPICAELIANQIAGEPFIVSASIASKLHPSRFLLREMGLKKIALSLF